MCPFRHRAEGARLRSRRAWQEASPIGHSTVKCFRTTEFSGTGTVLDNEDLGETTVGILRDMFGCNIKVLATAEDSPATHANPGRDAEGAAACARRRPYDYRLLRALLSNLQRDGLSFPVLDANASGQRILSAIAAGLQYVLPFDDSDPKARQAVWGVGVTRTTSTKTVDGR